MKMKLSTMIYIAILIALIVFAYQHPFVVALLVVGVLYLSLRDFFAPLWALNEKKRKMQKWGSGALESAKEKWNEWRNPTPPKRKRPRKTEE